ncbi:Putative tRNA (uracil-O(2)-)-methyltransferase [Heterocephalus glaber]|uniref:tRNA (uracil-O(2)-)-methyltransferase n=1 Tax=Heterocephalus glaber TaxID=10181 RepID=G5B307_HETGA|nr:Putative tRNA (uracil-O(2)-)-methyltransferase [Heterocephalus glaber]
MAEVGRRSVCDSYALLPGGFWAAVAVWLERPQVANKRLCGARLEARQSATLPRAEALRPRLSAGPDQEWGAALCRPQEGPGTRWGSPEEDHGTWPSAGPEQERGAALCGPQERPGPGRSSVEGHPGPRPGVGPEEDTSCLRLEETQGPPQQGKEQREAAAAPLLAEQPHRTGSGEEDDPAADLGSLWDRFSQSLVCGHPEMLSFLTRSGAESQTEAPHELDLVLRTVIPKTSPHFLVTAPRREIVVQDVPNGTVTFLPLEEDDEGNLEVKMSNVYQIQLSRSPAEWFISVLIFCPEKWQSDGAIYPRCTWLGGELLGRLARWCVASSKRELRSTLSLVSIGRYSVLYQELKEKYRDMVRVWPEVTDPEKFVYEDVAIASYLLILWEEERAERGVSTPQSFVDLGCGNGLLVHILCNEGENAITPSAQTLFPAADWLIGNHSDELTPWIPVIAARFLLVPTSLLEPMSLLGLSRSSYHCRFFVLPCCFFDFAGRFCRRQSRKTQYREYLDFIREVGEACGFHMEEDCLRIPSTKRVRVRVRVRVALAIEPRTLLRDSKKGPCLRTEVAWQLDRATLRRLKHECGGLQTLLRNSRQVFEGAGGAAAIQEDEALAGLCPHAAVGVWRAGVAETRGPGLLHATGGPASTSLFAFDADTWRPVPGTVLDGRVHIRDWRRELQREKHPEAKRGPSSEAFKTRICWFFTHHPDGCVLPSTSCPFAHGPQELRPPRPPKKKRQVP